MIWFFLFKQSTYFLESHAIFLKKKNPILDRHHVWRSLDPTPDISKDFVKEKKSLPPPFFLLLHLSFLFKKTHRLQSCLQLSLAIITCNYCLELFLAIIAWNYCLQLLLGIIACNFCLELLLTNQMINQVDRSNIWYSRKPMFVIL